MILKSKLEGEVQDFVTNNFLFGQSLDLLPDESLLENGIIDSTGVLEMIAFLEERYAITVEDNEVIPANLDSLDRIVQYVERKLNVGS